MVENTTNSAQSCVAAGCPNERQGIFFRIFNVNGQGKVNGKNGNKYLAWAF